MTNTQKPDNADTDKTGTNKAPVALIPDNENFPTNYIARSRKSCRHERCLNACEHSCLRLDLAYAVMVARAQQRTLDSILLF